MAGGLLYMYVHSPHHHAHCPSTARPLLAHPSHTCILQDTSQPVEVLLEDPKADPTFPQRKRILHSIAPLNRALWARHAGPENDEMVQEADTLRALLAKSIPAIREAGGVEGQWRTVEEREEKSGVDGGGEEED